MADEAHANDAYFPWTWTIESTDETLHACPSVSSLLGTFAAANGIVSALAVVFGHRLVVKKITCGAFGKRDSHSWKWMWIVPVGLQLAANALIALIIKTSAGYTADFKISELMLFLVARPRLGWVVLGVFAFKSSKAKPKREISMKTPTTPNPNQYLSPTLPYTPSHTSFHNHFQYPSPYSSQTALNPHPYQPGYHNVSGDESDADAVSERGHGHLTGARDFPWRSAFLSQFIGEFMLQIITLYIMGRTARFATIHGYYKISTQAYWQLPPAARMMYSGALYYLVTGSLFLIFAFLFILTTISRSKRLEKVSSPTIFITLFFLLISTWMGSWIFWAGFVKLAGNLYCPPKLIHQGVIWTIFSTIGILLGVGV